MGILTTKKVTKSFWAAVYASDPEITTAGLADIDQSIDAWVKENKGAIVTQTCCALSGDLYIVTVTLEV